eukprot:1144595-Pelagomonas_calceolata.AAC.3
MPAQVAPKPQSGCGNALVHLETQLSICKRRWRVIEANGPQGAPEPRMGHAAVLLGGYAEIAMPGS